MSTGTDSKIRQAFERLMLEAPRAQRPEVEELRERVKQLTRTERQLRAEHATEIRDLRDTIKSYANQVQVLALRAAQLEDDDQRLRNSVALADDGIAQINAAASAAQPAVRHAPLNASSAHDTPAGADSLTDDITEPQSPALGPPGPQLHLPTAT